MCRIFNRRYSSLPPKFFLLLQLEFPELSILEKNVNRRGHRDVKPRKAFHKTALDNIRAKKTHRRPKQSVAQSPTTALGSRLARRDRREAIDALHVVVDIAIGKMVQRMAEAAHGAVDEYFFMRIAAAPGRALAPEEADIVIGIPAAAAPPAVEIVNQARHGVGDVQPAVAGQRVFDFRLQLGRDPLVGVHQEDPLAGRLRMSERLLVPVPPPRPLDESV